MAFIIGRLLAAYLLLGVVKHVVPLALLARWAWRPPAGMRNHKVERRLVTIVVRLGQLIGLPDSDCLQRSLLLYHVLSRAGADPMLVVGFQQMNGLIIGHAWVIVDGHAVIEEVDLRRFAPALCFGLGGALLHSPRDAHGTPVAS
jgi:transglutaminase superfamily protein